MPTKSVGPEGFVIHRRMRETLGIKPSIDVTIEIKDDEIVVSKSNIEGSYTENCVALILQS